MILIDQRRRHKPIAFGKNYSLMSLQFSIPMGLTRYSVLRVVTLSVAGGFGPAVEIRGKTRSMASIDLKFINAMLVNWLYATYRNFCLIPYP
jgi:hypothetical protein